jgi:hypothetical protein
VVRKIFLLTPAIALLLCVNCVDVSFANAPSCAASSAVLGQCPGATAQINNGGVDVSASKGTPGSGSGSSAGKGAGKAADAPPPPSPRPPNTREPRDYYTVTLPVNISDLVNFKPAPGVDHMEPNGWMIVGLDTNFYATAQSQVLSGELLGQQASVRFTPVGYRWSYGDGQAASLSTRGSTWAALGIREFDPTPTSHVYTQPGGYDIDLTVYFTAEYRYAGAIWVPVVGTLAVPANRLHAIAGDAKTVLVERDCSVPPRGPGC